MFHFFIHSIKPLYDDSLHDPKHLLTKILHLGELILNVLNI